MRVVIADDSALMREGIAAFLVRAGIEVVAQAASGEDACAATSMSARRRSVAMPSRIRMLSSAITTRTAAPP